MNACLPSLSPPSNGLLPSVSLCLCLLLIRTLVVFRTYPTPGWLYLNLLITFARALFPNKVTFYGSEKDMNFRNSIKSSIMAKLILLRKQKLVPSLHGEHTFSHHGVVRYTCHVHPLLSSCRGPQKNCYLMRCLLR